MKKLTLIAFAILIATACFACKDKPKTDEDATGELTDTVAVNDKGAVADTPVVYMYTQIDSTNLVKIYEALGREAKGNVAVKLSTGEPGGHNFLDPNLVKALVTKVNGTIVECNTAYGGGRANTQDHLKAAAEHGFTAIAKVDIMDADGEVELPIPTSKHLNGVDYVGKNLLNYDFLVVLSHFKGHAMGGFGGAIKNISIGCASATGKGWIHSAGTTREIDWNKLPKQDDFLESMAEAASAITTHFGDKIIYISVANNLSVDCDCDSSPEDPKMADIGILASLDPVALDRACTDLVRSSKDHGKKHLIERIDSRHGMHTLDYAETELGIGKQVYKLVVLDAPKDEAAAAKAAPKAATPAAKKK